MTNYFITGSQAYGPVNKSSDTDIVMLVEHARTLRVRLEKLGIPIAGAELGKSAEDQQLEKMYRNGFYFNLGILLFNIIAVEDATTLEAWRAATEQMKGLKDIASHAIRVETFKSLRDGHLIKEEKNGIPKTS